MRIAWISSWPPRPCGIATYSADLVGELRRQDQEVYIICHPDGGSPGEKNVFPVMDTEKPGWDESVYTTVKDIKPDVVHIQHEYGLYQTQGDHAGSLFRPLFRWRAEGQLPVVVTYHSVYTKLNKMMVLYMDVMQRIVSAGVVHAVYQWAYLPVNIGRVPDNVYVIPHGANAQASPSKEEAKSFFGLEGKRVAGLIGWFAETKGFHRVLERWDSISKTLGPDTLLVLAGDIQADRPPQQAYKKRLLSLVEQSRYRDRIKVILGSFTPQEYDRVLASFDIMIMPYTFASQSGNLAHSFSHGVPVVASAMEGLKAAIEESNAGIAVPPQDDEELERAIVTLLGDDALRLKYSQNATAYVNESISWPRVAEKHLRLYRSLLSGKGRDEQTPLSKIMLEAE